MSFGCPVGLFLVLCPDLQFDYALIDALGYRAVLDPRSSAHRTVAEMPEATSMMAPC
jgi:hypothetical protein